MLWQNFQVNSMSEHFSIYSTHTKIRLIIPTDSWSWSHKATDFFLVHMLWARDIRIYSVLSKTSSSHSEKIQTRLAFPKKKVGIWAPPHTRSSPTTETQHVSQLLKRSPR